jgi:hypothetical protein
MNICDKLAASSLQVVQPGGVLESAIAELYRIDELEIAVDKLGEKLFGPAPCGTSEGEQRMPYGEVEYLEHAIEHHDQKRRRILGALQTIMARL